MKKRPPPPPPQPLQEFIHWANTEWPQWPTNWQWLAAYYARSHPGKIVPLLAELLEKHHGTDNKDSSDQH